MRRIERWAGLTRTVSGWDGLRRDPELWHENGDCLIHLYAVGQSRRGPSFSVPFHVLKRSNCDSMFSLCFTQTTAIPSSDPSNPKRASGLDVPIRLSNKVELFVPAPEDSTREASFRWHLTTRNFFAFILGKPLVGTHLGQAMVDLQERMCLFRSGPVDNFQDFLGYADAQGYRNFVDFPDYALATLYYAEHYKLRDIWIDAFAHCVGMNEKLVLSPEFLPQSRLTKALITRASLEMDIELGRTTLAVRNFLEDDLSPAYLGLTDGARYHLDRFRTFLHGFYVEKFGYWPPPKGTTFSKALYRSLYFDFKNLYDYLVDSESTADLASQRLASGGICVLQNINLFDKRHGFPSLPHPLPLLPCEVSSRSRKTDTQTSLRKLALGTKQGKFERHLSTRAALIMATNNEDTSVKEAPVIRAYMRFEEHCASSHWKEKVPIAEARKVRWLLIYGTLQYLISALRAPQEVRDTEGPKYPLCCLVTEHAQWQNGTNVASVAATSLVADAIDNYLADSDGARYGAVPPSWNMTIEPDCQNQDYLLHTNTDPGSRRVSVEIPVPLEISQSSRASSIRSHRRRSLSSLGSTRTSVYLKPQLHCEIVVHGYGNDMDDTLMDTLSYVPSPATSFNTDIGSDISWLRSITPEPTSHHCNERSCAMKQECCQTPELRAVRWSQRFPDPLPDDRAITSMHPNTASEISSSPASTSSQDAPLWSDGMSSASSKSSTYEGLSEVKISPAEECGLLGGLVPIVTPTLPATLNNPNRRKSFRFKTKKQPPSIDSRAGGFWRSPDLSSIGVAITDPLPLEQAIPSPSIALIPSNSFPLDKISRARSSASTTRVAPSSTRTKEPPSWFNSDEELHRSLTSRTGSSTLGVIPASLARAKSSSRKSGKNESTKVVIEAEETGKKERRKSFWRR